MSDLFRTLVRRLGVTGGEWTGDEQDRAIRRTVLAGILQVVKTSQVTSVQVVKMTITTIACTEQWLFFRFFFSGKWRQKRGERVAQDTPDPGKHEQMIMPVRERSLMFVFFTPESYKPALFFFLYFFAFHFSFLGTQLSSKEFPHYSKIICMILTMQYHRSFRKG